MTITEFLLARIDEDENYARSAPTDELFWVGAKDQATADAVNDHAVRWQPARVVAECEAKRLLVGRLACPNAPECGDPDCMVVHEDWQILAALYAEHPDYDPAWRL